MKNPNIKTEVVHSQTKSAWNVIGTIPGSKYKIARFPYFPTTNEEATNKDRKEAFEHAEFVSYCFNNSTAILADKILDNE